jgi:cytidylate kinase
MLVAAAASWLRGGKYYHSEDAEAEAQAAPGAEPVRIPVAGSTTAAPVLNGPGGPLTADGGRLTADRGPLTADGGPTAPLVSADELPEQIAAWRERALQADPPPVVVTISAAYGAAGSIIGPQVARRLGLPFVDRAIPATVAHALASPLSDAAEHDDSSGHGIAHLLATMARSVPQFGIQPVEAGSTLEEADVYRLTTEAVLWQVAATTGGVILGRAATIVLREHPGVLRVRLGGAAEARIAQASELEGIEATSARCRRVESDQAREAYARQFYGAEMSDSRLFDLTIDSTQVAVGACADIIVTAVTYRHRRGARTTPAVSAGR